MFAIILLSAVAHIEGGITMPKMKTHRGAAKRFSITKSGKVKRSQAFKRHILTKKTTKKTRNLRKTAYIADCEAKNVKKLIPYK